jgi:uncharacterized membrane protein YkvA (DUF1232 family)
MPVFNFDFNRSCTNLDLSAARSGIFTPEMRSLELKDDALVRFNALVRVLNPEHAPFSADQIAGAARRVLRAAAKGQESTFIKVRIRRAGEMRAALKDAQWDVTAEREHKMRAMVAYLDDMNGLIPNDLPIVGLLDDAILVDVVMDALRDELDEYADFCRFRLALAGARDVTVSLVDTNREEWMAERAQERRLEQQLRRVRGASYTRGAMENKFRIC